LRRYHGPIQLRAIVADDCQTVAFFKPVCRKATSQGADFFFTFGPGPGLPDTEIFFTNGGTRTTHTGIFSQQLGKCIEIVNF